MNRVRHSILRGSQKSAYFCPMKKKIIFDAIVWLAVALLLPLFTHAKTIQDVLLLSVFMCLMLISLFYPHQWLLRTYLPQKKWLPYIVGLGTLLVVSAFLFSLVLKQVEGGAGKNFISIVFTNLLLLFLSTATSYAYRGILLQIQYEKTKRRQVEAELKLLQSQVNPHFLFNSLNVLTTLVHKDADVAEQFINQLSKVYRYILESRAQEIIGLDEEMRNLEAYVFLMKIRFGGNFQFDNQLTNNVLGKKVAPLTLQMLVENALKHNEVSKLYPLSISVFLDGDFIVVKNNLQLKTNRNDSTGIGLSNIKARYSFLSQQPVSISETDGFFTVKIPLIH